MKSGRHVTSSMLMGIGYIIQVAFQMLYFLVLVRMLGPELFGHFAAALAAIMLVSPIAGFGYTEVALVRISQRPEDARLWAGNAIYVTALLGTLASVALATAYAVLNSGDWLPWYYILGLAFSELVITRCCAAVGRVHQASGLVSLTALNNGLLAVTRAVLATLLYLCGFRSIGLLIMALIIGLFVLLVSFYIVLSRRIGPMVFSWKLLKQEFLLATSFTAGMVSQAVYTDLDKLFLAKWTTPFIVGTYTAGYKILTLSFMPMRAVLEATISRQLQLANEDRKKCIRFTLRLLAANLSMASIIAIAMYFFAPYVTIFLGDQFEDSIGVLKIGFLLPVIQTAHSSLSNYLTAIGRQSCRTLVQIVVLFVYIAAGLAVIPNYSWTGAVYCTLACESFLAFLFGVGCVYYTWQDTYQNEWQIASNTEQITLR